MKLIAILILALGPMAAIAGSISCGIPPIPPIGCHVGDCVCDENGNNCHYVMVCR